MSSSLQRTKTILTTVVGTPNLSKLRRLFTLPKNRRYALDTHYAEKVEFQRLRDDFFPVGSPQYYDSGGTDRKGLYSENNIDEKNLVLTGEFEPLQKLDETGKWRAQVESAIKAMKKKKQDALFGIEAFDRIDAAEDAKWLVKLKEEHDIALKVQLTYNHQNQLATGCRAVESVNGPYSEEGLSPLGKEVANILMLGGIIIDVSHLNKRSTLDVCKISMDLKEPVPVIASHSNTRVVFEQGGTTDGLKTKERFARRCIDDEEIKAILETGGYVGLTFYPDFLSVEKSKDMLGLWVLHIEHVVEIAKGAKLPAGLTPQDSVAVASDVERKNGVLSVPGGYSKRKYKKIFTYLEDALENKKSRWKPADIDALFHGNVERVFHLKE